MILIRGVYRCTQIFFSPVEQAHPRKFHFTQFLLDYLQHTGGYEKLTDYMKREEGYDLVFIKAYLDVFQGHSKDIQTIDDPAFLLTLLDSIQHCAISHLPEMKMISETKAQLIQGKADSYNFYGLTKNWNSDEAGIVELVKIALDSKIERHLVVHYDNAPLCYVSKMGYVLESTPNKTLIFSSEQVQEITEHVLQEYRKGPYNNKLDRLVLFLCSNAAKRHDVALEAATHFVQQMQQAQNENDHIKTIGLFLRDIMQLHSYNDGNGRSLFILANWLLVTHGLKPFYPTQMCPFDGNSIEKIVKEIIEGQNRFAELFGTHATLLEQLSQYQDSIVEVEKMVKDLAANKKFPCDLDTPLKERNLNLLFRKTATHPEVFSLFKCLLDKCDVLNVDIFEKGPKSGHAFNIAKQYNNQKVMDVLQPLFDENNSSGIQNKFA